MSNRLSLGGATKPTLRLATAGSVDDGKSTLIGRLLYDSKNLFVDQIEQVREASLKRGDERLDLALLTDGLRAEREQGITIDVAYRYFNTPRRKFIIIDSPGHVQYTRNMVTGASHADLAVVLVDARKGMLEQSRRHAYLASLLRVPHLVFAVNKMDLVGYSQEVFEQVAEAAQRWVDIHQGPKPFILPMSALKGDNVVTRSSDMPWYDGPSLLQFMEELEVDRMRDGTAARFAVQWVIRPQSDEAEDYRGYAGTVTSGTWRPGDEVTVLPHGLRNRVRSVRTYDGELECATEGKAVTLLLEEDQDISRGDVLCHLQNAPQVSTELLAEVAWMGQRELEVGKRYAMRHGTRWLQAVITQVERKVDLTNLAALRPEATLAQNDIGQVRLKTSQPIAYDDYATNPRLGAFILVDSSTNETAAAGMLSLPDAGRLDELGGAESGHAALVFTRSVPDEHDLAGALADACPDPFTPLQVEIVSSLGAVERAMTELGAHLTRTGSECVLVHGLGSWRGVEADANSAARVCRELELGVLLLVHCDTDGINAALLTAEAVERDGVRLRGWVALHPDDAGTAAPPQLDVLCRRMPVPLVATVSRDGARYLVERTDQAPVWHMRR